MQGKKARSGTMLWVFEPLGFIALDCEKRIVDLGVLKPWISFRLIKMPVLIGDCARDSGRSCER